MRFPIYLTIIIALAMAAPLQAADDGVDDVTKRGFLKPADPKKRLTPEA